MKKTARHIERKQQWMAHADPQRGFERFFDYLPGVSIFAKDNEGFLMRGNACFLSRFGMKNENELLGKTDYDLFPATMADNFRKDDFEVMDSRQAKPNIIETFFNQQGLPDWYIANKLPVFSKTDQVIGVMGMIKSHKSKLGHDGLPAYEHLAPAIDYLRRNYKKPIAIGDLAAIANLSLRQFGRKFKDYYGITPQQFLIKTRVQAACEALRKGDLNLSELALELGFYDQSSFTLQFRKHMGTTPRRFGERKKLH